MHGSIDDTINAATRSETDMVRELFPRMVIMDEGRIVAGGATEALMEDEVLLSAHGLEKPL